MSKKDEMLTRIFADDFFDLGEFQNQARKEYKIKIQLLKEAVKYCFIDLQTNEQILEKLHEVAMQRGIKKHEQKLHEVRVVLNKIFFDNLDRIIEYQEAGKTNYQIYKHLIEIYPDLSTLSPANFDLVLARATGVQNRVKRKYTFLDNEIKDMLNRGYSIYATANFLQKKHKDTYEISNNSLMLYIREKMDSFKGE